MSTVSLPDRASLDSMRREARALQAAVRARRPDALALLATHAPGIVHGDTAPLHLTQLVVARAHGFTSWPALKHYFELAAGLRFDGGSAGAPDESPADRFCRLATLEYSGDDPARWAAAGALISTQPDLIADHIWAAASAVDLPAVRAELDRDPTLANRRGGPHRWSPLYYLTYSRFHTARSDDVMTIARLLLDAGADPHEGYLWGGQPLPFTLLTGAFGEGELGPERQPAHPHAMALARLFLMAGTDPNDGQTLYNRMFSANDEHLVLLFEFGLGRGDGGPWRARLGDLMDGPARLLQGQLSWAVDQGFTSRVRLLLAHGVDPDGLLPGGRRPVEAALLAGRPAIAAALLDAGATPVELAPADQLVAAALTGDRAQVDNLIARYPGVLAAARRRRPGLAVWATALGSADGVRLVIDLGFDVDALGRGDTPIEQPWQTALHQAAGDGNADLVGLLLSLGADPLVKDRRFGATPRQWAVHAGHNDIRALIEAAR